MSSPTKISVSPVGTREGTRVVLREITASLHNSPPLKTPIKSGNELTKVNSEHEVKVNFAREFADANIHPPGPIESSVSSASSFQSVTSTLSTKSSSGICPDSPARFSDSYNNLDVSGLDDLILACSKIRLNDTTVTGDQSFADATFTSATDELQLDQTTGLPRSRSVSPCFNDATQIFGSNTTRVVSNPSSPGLDRTWEIDALQKSVHTETAPEEVVLNVPENSTALSENATANETSLQQQFNDVSVQSAEPIQSSNLSDSTKTEDSLNSTVNESSGQEPQACLAKTDFEFKVPFPIGLPINGITFDQTVTIDNFQRDHVLETITELSVDSLTAINEPSFLKAQSTLENTPSIIVSQDSLTESAKDCEQLKDNSDEIQPELIVQEVPKDIDNQLNQPEKVEFRPVEEKSFDIKEDTGDYYLDSTVVLDSKDTFSSELDSHLKDFDKAEQEKVEKIEHSPVATQAGNLNLPQNYGEFAPQRQSTSLNCIALKPNLEVDQAFKDCELESQFFDAQSVTLDINGEFEKLKLQRIAQSIANDTIDNTSVELVDENDRFISASNDLFRDPSNFDFLLEKKANTGKNSSERLRDSLYVKFDPLVSNTNMLPQGNGATPPSTDERNGEKDISVPNIGTPKRNPAIAAIDRLLFYSPMSPGIQKNEESEKIESSEKNTSNVVPVVDSAMAEELELVKSTVLQLEEQLENEKGDNKNYQKQVKDLQETVNQLQKQLAKEIKDKNQINVVVDEYEKSISRLVAEREKDRKNQDVEKSALLEELQEVKNHLAASEAAFNDVHAKYERLKVVCTTSKNNEHSLKESIAENVATIKALENRYEQVKIHAAARLDKANEELDAMCKHHESEVVKLRAMLKKEELKSNSLTEMVEQKVKENKELTKILDEVIARVNPIDK